jgi:hypothetical protein
MWIRRYARIPLEHCHYSIKNRYCRISANQAGFREVEGAIRSYRLQGVDIPLICRQEIRRNLEDMYCVARRQDYLD